MIINQYEDGDFIVTEYSGGVIEKVAKSSMIELSLADAKTAKIAEINQSFTEALNTQFTSEATGIILTYDYSEESQKTFSKLAIAMISGLQTYPVDISLADGVTYVEHNQAQCQQVLASIAASEEPLRDKKKTLLEAVAVAKTVEDLMTIVW